MAGSVDLSTGAMASAGGYRDPMLFANPPIQERMPSEVIMQNIPFSQAGAIPVLPNLATNYGYEQIGNFGGSVGQTLLNPAQQAEQITDPWANVQMPLNSQLAKQYGMEQITDPWSNVQMPFNPELAKQYGMEQIGTRSMNVPGALMTAAKLLPRQQIPDLPVGQIRPGRPQSVNYDPLIALLAPKRVETRKLSLL